MWYHFNMVGEDIELLFANDKGSFFDNSISSEVFKNFDKIIIENKKELSSDVINIYNKFLPMKIDTPIGMKNELVTALKNFAKEKSEELKYVDSNFLWRFLMLKSKLFPSDYYEIAQNLVKLNYKNLAIEFIKLYEQKEENLPLKLLTLGNFYNLSLKDYKKAITYYEKYLKIDETKSVIYTIVGSLYSKAYGELSIKDQIHYFEKAYKLKPDDRLILHSLAFNYEKLGNNHLADKYYNELLKNNPTPNDYYNYGCFLIKCGDLEKGFKYFTHRFDIDDVNLKYPIEDTEKRWDFITDISQKTLLIFFEQGFGDTFMFCRFVPFLKGVAKHVIFVVQKELYDLIKNSQRISEGVEIFPDDVDIKTLDYDYHMALLDVPYVLKINSDNIPLTEGYLAVDEDRVKNYKEKYIKQSQNIKVGISYHGNKTANYNGRDINLEKFKSILQLNGVDFYSFSFEEDTTEGINALKDSFNNFTDTACALKNMDLVISTDNVILNLAGALGVKTFGLFNKYTNFRWYKLSGNDVGWYKSVIPFQTEEDDYWFDVLEKIKNLIKEKP